MPPDHSSAPSLRAARPLAVWQRVAFATAAVALGFFAARDTPPCFVTAPTSIPLAGREEPATVAPFFAESWVSPLHHEASAHGSAICALPGGELLAMWYGGTREGAADVALFTARRAAGGEIWSAPERVVDRALAQQELDRSIKKVGNAVIFTDRAGQLWMVYVSVSVGGWSGSTLNVKTSPDQGRTWSASQRLTLSPFFNLSTLVRNKPVHASDGRIGLPVYHELALKFPQMLWLTPGPDGGVADYRMRSIASATGLIQPSLVPLGGDRMLMMLRDRRRERRLHTAYSEDNGWTWSEPRPSALPNPDSAVDALRLHDGRILAVYNHADRGRDNLRLAVSADGGRTWRPGPILEAAEGREYSYPFFFKDDAGRIHLTYTWQRERIKYVEFNVAWLDRQLRAEIAGLE